MLHLVDRNKGGRNFNGISGTEQIHWKALFKASEDSLTSSVFGLLFYLPVEVFWSILTESCYTNELPPYCGRLISFEFWPRWGNERETHTEPDIFLQFEDFDLIIEAKRYDHNQQSYTQWVGEANSYYYSDSNEGKKLFLLAVGGITHGDEMATLLKAPDVRKETVVVKTRWRRLLDEIIKEYRALEQSDTLLAASSGTLNIFHDLVLSFRIHGFVTSSLLDTLPTVYNIRTTLIPGGEHLSSVRFRSKPFPQTLLGINYNSIQILSKKI